MGGGNLFYDWFPPYSFHLKMFAFCSGYFYKSTAESNVKLYILKKVRKLIIPLYIWNFVYAGIVSFLGLFGFTIGMGITAQKLLVDPIISGHQFVYYLGGWFIVPLFMVEVFNISFRTLIQKIVAGEHHVGKEVFFFTVHCLLGILGVHIASVGYHTGCWLVLTRFLFFLPFYGLGIFYKAVLEKYDQLPNIIYFAILFFAQWIIILAVGKIPTYTPSWAVLLCLPKRSISLPPGGVQRESLLHCQARAGFSANPTLWQAQACPLQAAASWHVGRIVFPAGCGMHHKED